MIPEKSLKEMYPNRFLEAADLGGKTVTVTIAKIEADALETEKGKKRTFMLNFVGKKKALVLNKTNACFIAEMFGTNPNLWEGKRIGLYPTKTRFGPDMVDCVRVYGSPDIEQDKQFAAKIGRARVNVKLRAMKSTERHDAPPPPEDLPEPTAIVLEAWSVLGWTREEGHKDMAAYQGDDYQGRLNALIDKANEQEAF